MRRRGLAGPRVFDAGYALRHKVTRDVSKPTRRAAEVGTDQVEGVEAVGVAVDDHPFVDHHRGRAYCILGRRARLECCRLFVGSVRKQIADALQDRNQGSQEECSPAEQRQETTPADLAAVAQPAVHADHQRPPSGRATIAPCAAGVVREEGLLLQSVGDLEPSPIRRPAPEEEQELRHRELETTRHRARPPAGSRNQRHLDHL